MSLEPALLVPEAVPPVVPSELPQDTGHGQAGCPPRQQMAMGAGCAGLAGQEQKIRSVQKAIT